MARQIPVRTCAGLVRARELRRVHSDRKPISTSRTSLPGEMIPSLSGAIFQGCPNDRKEGGWTEWKTDC